MLKSQPVKHKESASVKQTVSLCAVCWCERFAGKCTDTDVQTVLRHCRLCVQMHVVQGKTTVPTDSLNLHGRVPLSSSSETRRCDHSCNACRRTPVALVYQLRSIGCSLYDALEIHNNVLLVRRMRDSNHQAVED